MKRPDFIPNAIYQTNTKLKLLNRKTDFLLLEAGYYENAIFALKTVRLMNRYFIELSFKGTRYHGWQLQPNAVTVQGTLESVFSTFLRQTIEITGAGRTDTGVHASFYIAHFEADELPFPPREFVEKINRFLPEDIAVRAVYPVNGEAHARFSAVSRTYNYYISRVKNPFTTETSWQYRLPLDLPQMNKAAALLTQFIDFTSFSKLHTDVKTNHCKVSSAAWTDEGEQLVFSITADRFLRNMVRAIVGTLIDVGRGKISIADFVSIIEKKDRCAAGTSAPAQGLFLTGIEYPKEILSGFSIQKSK